MHEQERERIETGENNGERDSMETFQRSLLTIALPVTLQALLQSSFSVIDQIMIGQMGSDSIAGIGLGGKFASIFSVVLNAVAAAAGIMVAQYIGQKNEKQLARSFHVNMIFGILIAAVFMVWPAESSRMRSCHCIRRMS